MTRRISTIAVALMLFGGLAAFCGTISVDVGGGGDYTDIQTAIDNASTGDTIVVAAGTYVVDETIIVDKGVTIQGPATGTASVQGSTTDALSVFEIAASDVTLQNLDITWTHVLEDGYASPETADSLIRVMGSGLSGIQVLDNAIHTPLQDGEMKTWGARALTVDGAACTGITISGNTVYNTRNGIVIRYGNTAIVTDNEIYNTKGGIMQYTSSQTDADNRAMSGNTWGTVHNEWDIVWNSANYDPDYLASVLALSIANGDGYVVDRRDSAGGHAVGNRSHIFVATDGKTSVHECNGNMNDPYATFALGVEAVIAEGMIYVDIGTYQEQVAIDKAVEISGAGRDTTIVQVTSFPDGTDWGDTWTLKVDGNQPGLTGDVSIHDLSIEGVNNEDNNWFVLITDHIPAGVTLTLEDLRIAGSYLYGWWDYHSHGDLVFQNNIVEDVEYGMMLEGWDTGSVTIRDSEFSQVAGYFGYPAGMFLFTYDGIDCTNPYLIEGNVINNADGGYGIAVYGGYPGHDPAKYTDVTITGNDISGIGYYAVYLRNLPEGGDAADGGVHDALILLNDLSNNVRGIYVRDDNPGTIARYNDLSGNTDYGVLNTGTPIVDASLNWWGDVDGPSGEGTGAGSAVSTNVIFSPWLGIDPDGDAGTAGVQLVSPMLFVVDDVGPAPAEGYLNSAIGAANALAGSDAIEVRGGTYDGDEPVTDGVTLYNGAGATADTVLNGPITIAAADVLLGRFGQGFVIRGAVTVAAGVDASTIHINWNDLFDLVTNNDGDNTLDATFNYWGEDGPDTFGLVAINPILPESADIIIGYMDEFDLNALEAIDFSYLLDELNLQKRALVALDLMETFGFSLEDALELIDTYKWNKVRNALRKCNGDYDQFLVLLVGYAVEGPAGGGGGVDGEIEVYVAGDLVPLALELLNPITGEVVDDALVSYSVSRTLPDGSPEIVAFGVMSFDGDAGAFVADVDTTGLEPGIYDVYLGTDDGRSQHVQIEVTEG